MNNMNWWNTYENSKMYSKVNNSLGVTSEMIWGCQWDAMMRFILATEDANHVTATTNVGHTASEFTSRPYQTGGTNYAEVYTGTTEYNDKAVNIYDLEGNCYEWTQDVYYTGSRVWRGSYCTNGGSPSDRNCTTPTSTYSYCSSRLVLY